MATAGSCTFVSAGQLGLFFYIVGIYAPLFLVGLCYTALFSVLLYRRILAGFRVESVENQHVASLLRKTNFRRIILAKMLFVSFILYCLCYLPAPVMNSYYTQTYRANPLIFAWLRIIQMGGAVLTPVRYSRISLVLEAQMNIFCV